MTRRDKMTRARVGSKAVSKMMPFPLLGSGATALLILISCLMIITSAIKPQLVHGMRTAVYDFASPVLSVVSIPMQTAALFVRDVSGLAAMQSENMRLRDENIRLREWHQAALLLQAENKSLRDLMNVKLQPQYDYISARILSDTGRTFAKSVLVNAGKVDGVEKGQAVITSGGVVGRIIEAGNNTARILLITDMNSRVPVLVENSRQHAIFAGTNSDTGRLLHLPAGTELAEGTRIMTSGRGGIFPFGLPVGVIVKDENGMMGVKPNADFLRMIHVRVIDKPYDPYLLEGGYN